jgi:hypothetical protein
MGYIDPAMGLLFGIKLMFHGLDQSLCINWLELT